MQQIYKQQNMCTGCSACANVCPKQCITMQPDEKGFLYPQIDENACISCGLCQKVCHTYGKKKENTPQLFAFVHSNKDVLAASSSGGAFSHIAAQVLAQGGYVCGAVFDSDLKVKHIVSNKYEDLEKMRGSKYTQSDLGQCFSKIKTLLQEGKLILFSGSPCQIIGFQTFLGKEYDNLITVDFICHSVPSPLIFDEYVKILTDRYGTVSDFSFRDKRNGWLDYGVAFKADQSNVFIPHKENIYLRGFLASLYTRDCCSVCPAKERVGYSSDITIGDFWGVKELLPEMEYQNGVSAVIFNNEKGYAFFKKESLLPCDLQSFILKNPRYSTMDEIGKESGRFWKIYRRKGLDAAYKDLYAPTFIKKIKCKLKSIFKRS